MRTLPSHLLAIAAAFAASHVAVAAVAFNLDAKAGRGFAAQDMTWSFDTEPTVYVTDSVYTTAAVHAPHGTTGAAGNSNSSGSQYSPYSDFAQWKADMNGVWTLKMDEGLATEKDYTFSVAFNLVPADFPDFGIDAPGWNQAVGALSTLQCHGPAADTASVNSWYLYLSESTGYTLIMADWIAAGETASSWTPATPLALGDYELGNHYRPTLGAGKIVIGPAVDANGVTFSEWNPTATLNEWGMVDFSVATVPEPASLAMLVAGGCLLLRQRRAR